MNYGRNAHAKPPGGGKTGPLLLVSLIFFRRAGVTCKRGLLVLAGVCALAMPMYGQMSVGVPMAQPTMQTGAGQAVPTAQRTLPAGVTAGAGTQQTDGHTANATATTESEMAARGVREQEDRRDQTMTTTTSLPTEFQRLVADSTGSQLPIFGASLFTGVPSTFAPVDNIPVSPDYVIGPGDELRVQVYGQVNQQGTFVVDRNGDVAYPNVGTVHVAGVRYAQLEGFLQSQLGRVYRNFELTVNLGQLRSIQVFVVGGARRPGSYTVSSLSTLLNALFASGGPTPQGSLRDIQVQRSGGTVVHFDLYDLLLHGDKSKDVPLAPGDVIFIPAVGQQVAVMGSVNVPAIYEIKPGATVNQLLELAGGRTSVALAGQVRLERIFEHTMRSIIDVNLAQGQDPALMNGDIVTVGSITDRYKDAVTLRGNVGFPGRYVWHPGMRIRDLVPNVEQLVTRDYFRRRNALGNANVDYLPPAAVGSLQLRGSDAARQADGATLTGEAATSSKGGNSVGAALTSSSNVFPATTDVVLSAPDVDWNYAVVERLNPLTLATTLIPFAPGRLFKQGDESQNLELQTGDVVTFFSTADLKVPTSQQTRFVRLEGEFIASGVYSVAEGETLRQLLQRAGGLTPDAYLYGSEFTRQSTRRVQQQRLNEYADNLEAQTSAFAAQGNARAISERDGQATTAAAIESRQNIARLRRLVPLGRIVLQLKPDSRGVDSVPDLALEDGDRFVVPRVPATVSVEGQVYSSNAFVFERGRKEHDYLRQAGGPDREADRGRTFILRADGSVYSKQYGNVDRAAIFPGDTIVVPPQLERRAFLRNLLDLSAIIGQFGLGIAAINVLK